MSIALAQTTGPTPEAEFSWAYLALAMFIAVFFSSVELLTRYKTRGLAEIFGSVYFLAFACLNACLCGLVYTILPSLSSVTIKPELAVDINQGIWRGLTAGFGYLVVARTSVLDISVRGKQIGVGLDGIYNSLAQYFLSRHALIINRELHESFEKLIHRDQLPQEELAVFVSAAHQLGMVIKEDAEKASFKAALRQIEGEPDVDDLDRCLGIYRLMRDSTTGHVEVEKKVNHSRLSQRPQAATSDGEPPTPGPASTDASSEQASEESSPPPADKDDAFLD